MISFNFIFSQNNFIFIASTILSLLSILIYKYIIDKKFFTTNSHDGPQKIHISPTSRIGGGVIYLLFFLVSLIFFFKKELIEFIIIILGFLIIFFISLKEDISEPTNPILRLLLIFIASLFYILMTKTNFVFETKFIGPFLNIKIIQIVFLVLIISTVINGFNIFDGSNGHCSLIGILYLIIVLIISYKSNFIDLFYLLIPFISLIFIFLIFNFPKGLIFLGDTGAYLIGWITSLSIIYLLKNNKEISEIIFLNILFYPLMETIFSFVRKIMSGKSPFKPDKKHLHLKMIYFLKNKGFKNYNSLNTLYLSGVWFFPVIFVPFIFTDKVYLIFLLLFQICIYLLNYFIIIKKN